MLDAKRSSRRSRSMNCSTLTPRPHPLMRSDVLYVQYSRDAWSDQGPLTSDQWLVSSFPPPLSSRTGRGGGGEGPPGHWSLVTGHSHAVPPRHREQFRLHCGAPLNRLQQLRVRAEPAEELED